MQLEKIIQILCVNIDAENTETALTTNEEAFYEALDYLLVKMTELDFNIKINDKANKYHGASLFFVLLLLLQRAILSHAYENNPNYRQLKTSEYLLNILLNILFYPLLLIQKLTKLLNLLAADEKKISQLNLTSQFEQKVIISSQNGHGTSIFDLLIELTLVEKMQLTSQLNYAPENTIELGEEIRTIVNKFLKIMLANPEQLKQINFQNKITTKYCATYAAYFEYTHPAYKTIPKSYPVYFSSINLHYIKTKLEQFLSSNEKELLAYANKKKVKLSELEVSKVYQIIEQFFHKIILKEPNINNIGLLNFYTDKNDKVFSPIFEYFLAAEPHVIAVYFRKHLKHSIEFFQQKKHDTMIVDYLNFLCKKISNKFYKDSVQEQHKSNSIYIYTMIMSYFIIQLLFQNDNLLNEGTKKAHSTITTLAKIEDKNNKEIYSQIVKEVITTIQAYYELLQKTNMQADLLKMIIDNNEITGAWPDEYYEKFLSYYQSKQLTEKPK